MVKRTRKTKEEWKTYSTVFDQFVNKILFNLASVGHFEEILSPISVGKEAKIFTARTKQSDIVILKIYRLQTCDFNRMFDYIKLDPRYIRLRRHKRKIIFAWAQREFRNLLKALGAGVSCPKPIAFKYNVLILESIGGAIPAPKLKDAIPENPKKFLGGIIKNMKRLYKAGLVHGDLSSFNILNDNEKPVLIDFSQCSPLKAANTSELLQRDATNIANFFKKLGLKITPAEILKKVKDEN